jgi:Helix-turn-helix domain
MIFDLHIPSFPLNRFIECFIYYRDYNPVHSIDRFLPDGNVNIVIDLTGSPKHIYDNESLKRNTSLPQCLVFRENVGLTPKGFLKIIRFQKAIQEIASAKQTNWTSIALESGYYDQAHFINDFKTFSGFTPKQYVQKQYEHLNYIPNWLR